MMGRPSKVKKPVVRSINMEAAAWKMLDDIAKRRKVKPTALARELLKAAIVGCEESPKGAAAKLFPPARTK